ncbi:MAG: amidohydrolase, partial [Gemmatimonadales bacterium]
RRTLDDKNPGGWFAAQKVTVEEALRAYTSENAYGVFAEGRRGVLKPGARADVVLLDRDITTIDPVDIPNTQVVVTVAGGQVVYRAP